MRFRPGGLWRHHNFLKLWSSHTVSQFGYQISFLAVPLLAVLVLDATPLQMGVLIAVGGLPTLFIGLLAGAWVDRRRRRPVLIAANWSRALLLLVIPITAWLGVLSIELLYLVAFGLGNLGLLFDVAHRSFLPSLVERNQIIEANSNLELGRSASEVAGPGVAGVLVQLVSAQVAILVNAVTFLASAILLQSIKINEAEPVRSGQEQTIWKEAGEGLKSVVNNPILRTLAISAGIIGLFNAMQEAVWILYIVRQLDLSPSILGLIFSIGSIGLLLGAAMGRRTTKRIGLGPSIILGVLLVAVGDLIIPLATGPTLVLAILLAMAQFLFGIGVTTYNIGQVSVRQLMTPDHLQGRVNATMRVVTISTIPVGALIGGYLGESISLRPTLFVGVAGEMLAVIFLLLSPLRSVQKTPPIGL